MVIRVKIWMKVVGGFAIIIALMIAATFIAYRQNMTVSSLAEGYKSLMSNAATQDMMQRIIEILQARENAGGQGLRGSSVDLRGVADEVTSIKTMVAGLVESEAVNDSQRQRLRKMDEDAGKFRSDYMAYLVERGNKARFESDWGDAVRAIEQSVGPGSELSDELAALQIAALHYLKDRQPVQWDAYESALRAFAGAVDRIPAGPRGAGVELRNRLKAVLDDYGNAMISTKTFFQKEAEAVASMTRSSRDIVSASRSLEEEMVAAQEQSSVEAIRLMLLVLAVAVAAGVLIAIFIAGSITRPMTRAVSFASAIAEGDLTYRLGIRQHDEVGLLGETLDRMAARLGEIVTTIQSSAEQVAASSEEISASSTVLSEGAQSQASTLEQTSASVEELTASIDQVSSHAQSQARAFEQGSGSMAQVQKSIEEITANLGQIADLARQSLDKSQQGAQAVDQVVSAITLISGSSEKIAGIVSVISEIANQTNLLALNASIEAARAGEYGRGFAVVADEVSKLADRSSTSAKEIEALIQESVKNVTRGVERARGSMTSMEEIKEAAQQTSDMITNVSTTMQQQLEGVRELTRAMENISEMSQSISAATEEQAASAREVSKAVESVNNLTQSGASSTEAISSSAEQLSYMAQQLHSMTTMFKVSTRDGDGKEPAAGQAGAAGNGNGQQVVGDAEIPGEEPSVVEPAPSQS
jgi:methyl-accepting chemotaxis protein